ncbi:hypothetical protein ACFU99_42960, partial [Streptomyces sp. NPDC057654]|uniref:hypothetical protein n=1 Tax=Streptomyces sp. NPDC057654 TaxID=3346196 RepID=UPI00369EC35C
PLRAAPPPTTDKEKPVTAVLSPLPPEALAGQQIDLLRRLADVLSGHPLGASFRLLAAPTTPVAVDEVLVQTVTAEGVIELRPRKITDLAPDDVLHTTQVLDPADTDFTDYSHHPRADICMTTQRPDGSTGHLYY